MIAKDIIADHAAKKFASYLAKSKRAEDVVDEEEVEEDEEVAEEEEEEEEEVVARKGKKSKSRKSEVENDEEDLEESEESAEVEDDEEDLESAEYDEEDEDEEMAEEEDEEEEEEVVAKERARCFSMISTFAGHSPEFAMKAIKHGWSLSTAKAKAFDQGVGLKKKVGQKRVKGTLASTRSGGGTQKKEHPALIAARAIQAEKKCSLFVAMNQLSKSQPALVGDYYSQK